MHRKKMLVECPQAGAEDLQRSVAESVFISVMSDAHKIAELTAAFAERLFPKPLRGEDFSLPVRFVLELAAVVRLAVWETAGLGNYLPNDLRDWRLHWRELLQRCQDNGGEFAGPLPPAAASLAARTNRLFRELFLWPTLSTAGIYAVVKSSRSLDIETLADFLWRHRGSLADEGTAVIDS